MVAHCFREKKERACRVEKNRCDHFNSNVRRTTCRRNAIRPVTFNANNLTPDKTIFCLAKSAQHALHYRAR
jgi:hypothetical protein